MCECVCVGARAVKTFDANLIVGYLMMLLYMFGFGVAGWRMRSAQMHIHTHTQIYTHTPTRDEMGDEVRGTLGSGHRG